MHRCKKISTPNLTMVRSTSRSFKEDQRNAPRKMTTCKVINGRARVVCRTCERHWYISVPFGINEKLVRCQCGTSTFIHLDRRSHPREPICRLGTLIFPQNYTIPVFLSDCSLNGISFLCTKRDSLLLIKGLHIKIKYRTEDGEMILREICIRNSREQRIGAQFQGLPLA